MFRRLTQLALLLLALDATLCLAEEDTEEVTESRWRLGAALGYGSAIAGSSTTATLGSPSPTTTQ